jgi:hypothetical protein
MCGFRLRLVGHASELQALVQQQLEILANDSSLVAESLPKPLGHGGSPLSHSVGGGRLPLTNAVSRSIGSGKTIVELLAPAMLPSVCR